MDQIGIPWHWGFAGLATGDSANLLTANVGDPHTFIPEFKAFLCDVAKASEDGVMAIKALLIDLPRCTGCRGCQVACKQEYKRQAEKTTFFGGPGYQNPADLSAQTWCPVTYNEVLINGRYDWVFGKRQCMHCTVPGCASACPVKALEKFDSGPVVYHRDKCIGCRYCMLACPFVVPRFEYETCNPYITKCTMCGARQAAGGIPACAKACPTGAITFGERDALVREAEHRIASNPGRYVHHSAVAPRGPRPGRTKGLLSSRGICRSKAKAGPLSGM